jgi:hypothetical protein
MSEHDFAGLRPAADVAPVALGVTWTPVGDLIRRPAQRPFLPGKGRVGAHRRGRRADQRPRPAGQVAFRDLRVSQIRTA